MKKANTNRLIKEANTFLVFQSIMEFEPVTIERCIRKTHLSRPTVLTSISRLLEERLIERSGVGESACGRQPALYSLKRDFHFAIGIDFEYPPMRIVISDIAGKVVYSNKWTQNGEGMQAITESILSQIERGMKTLGLSNEMVVGIGIGIPGTLNIHENKPVHLVRVSGWDSSSLLADLEEQTDIPIYLRNDVHLVALAERHLLDIKEDFIYIAYRFGIGSAIFLGDTMYDGEYGNAGYFGHTTIDIHGEECVCGKRGCLETYCAKPVIEKKYLEKTGSYKTYTQILKCSEDADEAARSILTEAGIYLGMAIANYIKLFDLSQVILGFLECNNEHLFYKTISDTVNSLIEGFLPSEISIRCGVTSEYDFALGGCLFALKNFFAKPELKLTV